MRGSGNSTTPLTWVPYSILTYTESRLPPECIPWYEYQFFALPGNKSRIVAPESVYTDRGVTWSNDIRNLRRARKREKEGERDYLPRASAQTVKLREWLRADFGVTRTELRNHRVRALLLTARRVRGITIRSQDRLWIEPKLTTHNGHAPLRVTFVGWTISEWLQADKWGFLFNVSPRVPSVAKKCETRDLWYISIGR